VTTDSECIRSKKGQTIALERTDCDSGRCLRGEIEVPITEDFHSRCAAVAASGEPDRTSRPTVATAIGDESSVTGARKRVVKESIASVGAGSYSSVIDNSAVRSIA